MNLVEKWAHFPMGPTVRRYLGISEQSYRGEGHQPSSEEVESFTADMLHFLRQNPIDDFFEWLDLLEELTGMGLSKLVIFLAEEDLRPQASTQFRALLSIGSSYMLEESYDQALAYFEKAQEQDPEEIAPYTNIAAIHYAFGRDQNVVEWAKSGLEVEPNHQRLWELIASVYLHTDRAVAGEKLKELAHQLGSYMGLSLAAELISPNDSLLKAQYLEELFHSQQQPTEDFLIEYTAALGVAQQFEKIPATIWRAERIGGIKVPWKAYSHAAQAYLAMEKFEEAQTFIDRIKKMSDVPQNIVRDLESVYDQQASETHH